MGGVIVILFGGGGGAEASGTATEGVWRVPSASESVIRRPGQDSSTLVAAAVSSQVTLTRQPSTASVTMPRQPDTTHGVVKRA